MSLCVRYPTDIKSGGEMNFGGLDPEYTGYEKSRFAVIPVPYDLTTTYEGGARKGPAAILEASANMELYDEELGKETYLCGIHTLPALQPIASGPADMIDAVERVISPILNDNKVPVMLGGEHSISIGAVRAALKACPGITVLHLDAHADLRDAYQGTPYSHACFGRRVAEIALIVQAGIRSMSAEEAEYLKSSRILSVSADSFREKGFRNILDKLNKKDVYLSVDLDVFDPSIMPSTGTPEPGGLTWNEVTGLIREISRSCNVRAFDVVELSPIPGMIAPDFLASKLIYRIMGYLT